MSLFSSVWAQISRDNLRITQLEAENRELQAALQSFALPDPPEFPIITLTGMEAAAVIRLATNLGTYLLDNVNRITDERDFLRFLVLTRASREKYMLDAFDCDNFALEFMADCLKWGSNCALITGYFPGGPHAWVGAVVSREGVPVFVQAEPQLGTVAGAGYVPQWVMLNG